MDYSPPTPHYWNPDWVDSCPSHTNITPSTNMYMQYASESQAPVLVGPADMTSQHHHDRQLTADGHCPRQLQYAMHGPPTTWSAGTDPSEPANLEQASGLGLYYDYQPGYSPSTPPYYARLPALYVNTEVTDSPLFLSSAAPSPVTPLHTDEAFARMQRQCSGYIPSISTALDAPISRRDAAVVVSSPGAHQSDISRAPLQPTPAREPRKVALLTRTKAEPDSPTLSPSPEPVSKQEESASPKSKSSLHYTHFRLRKGKSAGSPECAEQSESSSAEPSTPPLQINAEAIQIAKRGLSRARRTQHLACFFCRRRKIACVAPDTDDPDRTCNQCERRGLSCSFPAESHRGLRYKARDTGRRSATSSEDKHTLAG